MIIIFVGDCRPARWIDAMDNGYSYLWYNRGLCIVRIIVYENAVAGDMKP